MRGQYDVIVVGAGPAGLSAALYAARAKYRVLVLEKEKMGGQITITSEIVNYPGVEKTDGTELTEQMRRQAEAFGAEFAMAEVTGIDLDGDIRTVKTDKGEYRAPGIVLAVGANPRKLGFVGEQEYQGRGVAYCATCDGEFFTGMDVFVIGGGFAAAEEAVFLTKYAKKLRSSSGRKTLPARRRWQTRRKTMRRSRYTTRRRLWRQLETDCFGARVLKTMHPAGSGPTKHRKEPPSGFLYLPDTCRIRNGWKVSWSWTDRDTSLRTGTRRQVWTASMRPEMSA